MTRSSASLAPRRARTVDELVAAEWTPDELTRQGALPPGGSGPSGGPADGRNDDIAAALATRERELQAELERQVEAAYAQGYEEGRQAGEIGEAARLRTAVQAAEDALDALRAGEARWRDAIEENISALAIAVARQILGRELKGDAATVVELVRRAVAEFPIDQPLRIRVSPQDLVLLSSATDAGGAVAIAPGREARWIADPLIGPGSCVVEGRERIVDGRVDNALERLYRRLTYTHA